MKGLTRLSDNGKSQVKGLGGWVKLFGAGAAQCPGPSPNGRDRFADDMEDRIVRSFVLRATDKRRKDGLVLVWLGVLSGMLAWSQLRRFGVLKCRRENISRFAFELSQGAP